ncbi:hypothetical protein HYALB_00012673 [Hymenoscyphus albidus]|uniref:Uncharacterized protein n=1 Tax=Hymenoscyphus albidus TaxID=595503 RepID=A0A9N9Q4E0_9HELO|nr:hypothetical protein HYALB_00012673 [Hymenoscyphus albidus]
MLEIPAVALLQEQRRKPYPGVASLRKPITGYEPSPTCPIAERPRSLETGYWTLRLQKVEELNFSALLVLGNGQLEKSLLASATPFPARSVVLVSTCAVNPSSRPARNAPPSASPQLTTMA